MQDTGTKFMLVNIGGNDVQSPFYDTELLNRRFILPFKEFLNSDR